MALNNVLKRACVVFGIFVMTGTFPALGSSNANYPFFSASNARMVGSCSVPLCAGQDRASVVTSDGIYKVVQVEMRNVSYTGNLVEQMAKSKASWTCYELESKDRNIPYSWYLWLDNPSAGMFKLFITPTRETYLTYVDMGYLCFVEVSKPMDSAEKMKRLGDKLNHKQDGIRYVDIRQIIDGGSWIDKNTTGHYISIYLTSLQKDAKGGFILKIHGKDPSVVYTLISDKEAEYGWRLE